MRAWPCGPEADRGADCARLIGRSFVRRLGDPPQGCRSSACGPSSAGTSIRRRRWPDKSGLLEVVMTDNRARNGTLGAILGALIASAFAVFLLNGGEHVGKKTVKSDADLPPVATGQPR